jgi:hypothetical protein
MEGTGPISAAAEEVISAMARFDPGNLAQLEGIFPDLCTLFGGLARGIGGLAAKYGDDLPVKPVVAEAISEIAASLGGLSAAAEEAHGLFRSAHQDEIERIENPRPNEKVWDTTSNQ